MLGVDVSGCHNCQLYCSSNLPFGLSPVTIAFFTALFICLLAFQDAVDRGWLLDEASHFSGVLGLNRLLLTALELAKALAYLHRLDILHGDLTGGNVMLTSTPATANDPRGFTVKVQL